MSQPTAPLLHLLPPGWNLRLHRGTYDLVATVTGPSGERFTWCSGLIEPDSRQAHEAALASLSGFLERNIPLMAFVSPEDAQDGVHPV